MREIKFRIYFEGEEPFMSEPITLENLLHGEDIEFRNEDDTLSLPLNDFRFFYKRNQNYKIMQFTGLHDKNGKEIYEGDIVHILGGEYEQGFYEWDEKVQIKDLIYDGFNLMMTISQIGNNSIEVIGNIYENPELLERSSNGERLERQ